jgi:hypothetical protein
VVGLAAPLPRAIRADIRCQSAPPGVLKNSRRAERTQYAESASRLRRRRPTSSKELVAGYWLWQVSSLDEAIEWIKRAPFPDGVELEIRPLQEF